MADVNPGLPAEPRDPTSPNFDLLNNELETPRDAVVETADAPYPDADGEAGIDAGAGDDAAARAAEIDRKAREEGWVPKNEWKSDPAKWLDAETHLKRVEYQRENVLPVVKRAYAKLQAELDETRKVAAEAREFFADQSKKRRALEIDTLRLQRRDAMDNSDHDTVAAIDDKLLDFKLEDRLAPAKANVVEEQYRRVGKDFEDANPWVNDADMQELFREEAAVVVMSTPKDAKGRPNITPERLLERAKERLMRSYPEKFKNGSRAGMTDMGGAPSGGNAEPGRRSITNLKPDFRQAFERQKKSLQITEKQFLEACTPDCFRS